MADKPTYEELEKRVRELEEAQSARKRAEEELKEAKKRLEIIFNLAPAHIWQKDQDGKYLQVNEGYCEAMGLSREAIIGKTDYDIFPKDIAGKYVKDDRRIMNSGRSEFGIEEYHKKASGELGWSQTDKIVFHDKSANIIGTIGFALDITERKEAEAALRESEKRHRRLFETMAQGILYQAPDGTITSANPAAERILGRSLRQIRGKTSMDPGWKMIREDGSEVRGADHPTMVALRTGRKVGPVIRGLFNPGKNAHVWLYITAIPLFKPKETFPYQVYATFEDITERKLAELELSRQRERLAGIIRGTNAGTWEWNVQTGEAIFNERWAEVIGYSLEEISPVSIETWEKLCHPDDLKISDELLQKHFRGELDYYEFESRMQHKSGEWVWVLDRGRVVTWTQDGKPLMMMGTHQDITRRKLAERENQINEARLEIINTIAGMPEASEKEICDVVLESMLSITDSPIGFLGFLTEDETMMQIHAWSSSAMAGCRIHDKPIEFSIDKAGLWGEPVRNRKPMIFNDYSADHPASKGYPEGHVEISRFMEVPVFDGERIVGLAAVANKSEPYNDTDVRQLTLLMESWWEQVRFRRMNLEKELLQAQLAQAHKMESVGRLAGGVAHDFNNMLGVILGHTDMALEYLEPDQPLHSDLREIRKAAVRSADLVRQLLAFARKQDISPKVLDLNDTVAGMLKMLKRLIGEDIHLLWQPGADLWKVRMDATQIDQILANLCVNARDAIEGLGEVTIVTENVTLDEDDCNHHLDAVPGDYVLLAVSDDGCGMDKEILPKLFEPFFTTKEVGKGTGLGLPTVYGIVRQNSGFVNVYSEPGKGSTFRIYIPRHIEKAEAEQKRKIETSFTGGDETVLLVEDEPSMLQIGRTLLERLGYKVLATKSPAEAIKMAQEHKNGIHLLITDVIMPEMNGRELADKLLSLYPELKFLFMSGYTADVIAHHGVLDAGVKFVQKPFSIKDLANKIREALES